MSLSLPANAIALPALPPRSTAILDAPRPMILTPVLLGMTALIVFVVGFVAWSTMAPLAEAAVSFYPRWEVTRTVARVAAPCWRRRASFLSLGSSS